MNYIYCDESCYLKHDRSDVMVLGGISCNKKKKNKINAEIKKIKEKYGLNKNAELKWTKLGNTYLPLYIEILDYILKKESVKIGIIIIKNKKYIHHKDYFQTHNDWYNKMYYLLFNQKTFLSQKNMVFMDKKDNSGGKRAEKLTTFLGQRNTTKNKYIGIYQIDSKESSLMQVIDIFIGMCGYYHRFKDELSKKDNAKTKLVNYFLENYNTNLEKRTPYYKRKKINIYIFNLKKVGDSNE